MVISVNDIKINPDNPRLIKDDKFEKLVKSIKEFPQMLEIRPIVVNDEMVVLGGNMRLRACIEAGLKEVPVIKASSLSPEQQKEFIIKDNIGFGEWDWDVIANDWDVEKVQDWGLDIPDFVNKGEAVEDDYEMPDEIETDIVLGDLFEIGEHRLLCGDSTNADDSLRLMNGEFADMIFTDPPYGVNYAETNAAKSSRSRSEITGDEKTVNDISESIWSPAFKNLYDNAKDDCSFYMTMCQGGDQMMMMMMSQHWQVKHEPIIYGWKKKHNWYGLGQYTKSVWEIAKPSKSEHHPTMKPVELVGNAILNSSKKDDLIIDLFLGSGTTMVATHQLNRKCYGMEIDPKYCQVIVDRMLKLDPSLEIKRNGQLYKTGELQAI